MGERREDWGTVFENTQILKTVVEYALGDPARLFYGIPTFQTASDPLLQELTNSQLKKMRTLCKDVGRQGFKLAFERNEVIIVPR